MRRFVAMAALGCLLVGCSVNVPSLPSAGISASPEPGVALSPNPTTTQTSSGEQAPAPNSAVKTPTSNETPAPITTPAPVVFRGEGRKGLVGPVAIVGGVHEFKALHNGDGNFAVWLVNPQGENVDLLFNVIGSGSFDYTAVIPSSGNYYFKVELADGNWAVAVDHPASLTLGGSGPIQQPSSQVNPPESTSNFDAEIAKIRHIHPFLDKTFNKLLVKFAFLESRGGSSVYFKDTAVTIKYSVYENDSEYQATKPSKGSRLATGTITATTPMEEFEIDVPSINILRNYVILEYTAVLPDGREISDEDNFILL